MQDIIESELLPPPIPPSPYPLITSLKSLSLHHFRNYASARIEVTPAPVVLTGHNGAGKTNILEAISLLAPGRGIRRAKLGEMNTSPPPPAGEGRGRGACAVDSGLNSWIESPLPNPPPQGGRGYSWAIAASLHGMQGQVKIGTGRDPESASDKRLVKIDGKIKGQAELARHFAAIWLTPQMEQLFHESASAGRKFLDRLVYSFDPEHASRINEYDYAMRERNRLLQDPRADGAWLDALERTMAETAAAIAQARLHTAGHINHAIESSGLSFPKAHLRIAGNIEDMLAAGAAAVGVEEDCAYLLKLARPQDRAAGRALSGIHRSALQVIHVTKQMPAEYCSTGEQKALLLSIVLAQARAGRQWHGVVPVLLLDEVVAHLDATRRLELFQEICQIGAQTWMTGTDAGLFAGLEGKAQYYQVDGGVIHDVE